MFSSVELKFSTAEYKFNTAELTFKSFEHNFHPYKKLFLLAEDHSSTSRKSFFLSYRLMIQLIGTTYHL